VLERAFQLFPHYPKPVTHFREAPPSSACTVVAQRGTLPPMDGHPIYGQS
jgi:hypothetical protein